MPLQCSGGNPCERCEKKDVDCVYAQFEKDKKRKIRKSATPGQLEPQRTSTSGSGSSNQSQTSGSRMPPMDTGGNPLSIETRNDFNREQYSSGGMMNKPLRRSPRFATFDHGSDHDQLQGLDFSSTGPYHFDTPTKVVEGISGVEGGAAVQHSPIDIASEPPLMPTLNSTTSQSDLLSPSSTTSSSSVGSDDYKRVKGPLESSLEVTSSSHEALSVFSQTNFDREDPSSSMLLPSQQVTYPRPGRLVRSVFQ